MSLDALQERCPQNKALLIRSIQKKWRADLLDLENESEVIRIVSPGKPDHPVLVNPRDLEKRRLSTMEGRAVLIHAIAHIELNAINLALDAVYRFRDMPKRYYSDWLRVAEEEAKHHHLLCERLEDLGYQYGDFSAHNGLWDMALQTDSDLMLRMALIPCVFEARGLDVTPKMIKKFEGLGDNRSAEILRLILQEEIHHVAIGQRWFRYECDRRRLDSEQTLVDLISEYLPGRKHGPFNVSDRLSAGFTEPQLQRISNLE